MVSAYTPNINLEEPARGDQVGTWDTPVNNNETLTDLVVGGIATIVLNNAPVVLASAQFQAAAITFSSTLTGSVAITFPSTFKKAYKVRNTCTGSSAFVVTLQTTVAGGQVICCPPGESVDCINDGSNIYFHNLERIGSYWDYAGSSVPAWVDGCSPVKPYLPCTATTFASSTYPQLAIILGSTTTPDSRGRTPYALNGGTGRLTIAGAGIDGNTVYASGGSNGITLGASQIPTITSSGTITVTSSLALPGSSASISTYQPAGVGGASFYTPSNSVNANWRVVTAITGSNSLTYTNSSQSVVANAAPGYVAGVRMIRSA